MLQRAVQLKIILENTKPEVWRKLHILDGSSLRTLHYAIQDIFWWKGYHSYVFKISDNEYADPEFDTEFNGWMDDSKFKVGKIIENFSEFKFIYDFGALWSHKIIFEGFVDANIKEKYPVCIDGKNAAPPEDVGGPSGFEEFKIAIKNKNHEHHEELMNLYDGGFFQKEFRADWFDLELTNMRIGRRVKPRVLKSVRSPELAMPD